MRLQDKFSGRIVRKTRREVYKHIYTKRLVISLGGWESLGTQLFFSLFCLLTGFLISFYLGEFNILWVFSIITFGIYFYGLIKRNVFFNLIDRSSKKTRKQIDEMSDDDKELALSVDNILIEEPKSNRLGDTYKLFFMNYRPTLLDGLPNWYSNWDEFWEHKPPYAIYLNNKIYLKDSFFWKKGEMSLFTGTYSDIDGKTYKFLITELELCLFDIIKMQEVISSTKP